MREKILAFIEKNSRIDLKELAIMLGVTAEAVVSWRRWRRSISSAATIR